MAQYSAADIYDLWRLTVPEDLVDVLEEAGDELPFLALSAVGAVLSEFVERMRAGQFAATATAGVCATGTIRVTRAAGGGVSTLKSGASFKTGRRWRVVTTADAILAVGTTDVPARALLTGLSGNLADGTALDFEEGSFTGFDCGQYLSAVALGAFSGGVDAQLETIGLERGGGRQTGETGEQYRARLRRLPDTVCGPGIERTVRRIMQQLTGTVRPTVVVVDHYAIGAVGDLDPFDSIEGPEDQKGNPPGSLVYLSGEDSKTGFTIYVSPLPEIAEGLVMGVSPADLYAVDVLAPASYAGYQRLYEAINKARAAGVGFYLARTIDWPSYEYGYDPGMGYYDYDYVYDFPS